MQLELTFTQEFYWNFLLLEVGWRCSESLGPGGRCADSRLTRSPRPGAYHRILNVSWSYLVLGGSLALVSFKNLWQWRSFFFLSIFWIKVNSNAIYISFAFHELAVRLTVKRKRGVMDQNLVHAAQTTNSCVVLDSGSRYKVHYTGRKLLDR
jgi:hypothetical protein